MTIRADGGHCPASARARRRIRGGTRLASRRGRPGSECSIPPTAHWCHGGGRRRRTAAGCARAGVGPRPHRSRGAAAAVAAGGSEPPPQPARSAAAPAAARRTRARAAMPVPPCAAARRSSARSSPAGPARPPAPPGDAASTALRRAEVPQQRAPPRRPDAPSSSKIDSNEPRVAALAVEAEREAVRLVADPLQQLEAGRVARAGRSGRRGPARRPPPRASRARSPRRAAGRTPASPRAPPTSWPLPPSMTTRFGVAAKPSSHSLVRSPAAGARSGARRPRAIAAKSSCAVAAPRTPNLR